MYLCLLGSPKNKQIKIKKDKGNKVITSHSKYHKNKLKPPRVTKPLVVSDDSD